MNTDPANGVIERTTSPRNERQSGFPLARSRGWPFVLAWGHRISGIVLILLSCLIVYLLAAGSSASQIATSAQMPKSPIFTVLLLAFLVPVLMHASNGGRLILYELFGYRKEDTLLHWMLGLSLLYYGVLILIMNAGDQIVSSFFFWLMACILAVLPGIATALKTRRTQHSMFWKWQRISGASLLALIPAYPLYLYLNPSQIDDAGMMLSSFQVYFIKGIHILVILGIFYHSGYGLLSIGWDYLASRSLRNGLTVLVTAILLVFIGLGIKLIF